MPKYNYTPTTRLVPGDKYYGMRDKYLYEVNIADPGKTITPVEPNITRTTVNRPRAEEPATSTQNSTTASLYPTGSLPTGTQPINFSKTNPSQSFSPFGNNYLNQTGVSSGLSNLGYNYTNMLTYLPFLAKFLFGVGGGQPPEGAIDETAMGGGLDDLLAEVGDYVNELRSEAQADYDLIIKYLTKEHQMALGENDQERAKFFELVANEFEKRVGQIPFDYYRKTQREQEDVQILLQEADRKFQDLGQRQEEFGKQQQFEVKQETEGRGQEFNARGFLGSGLEKKKAQEQTQYRDLFVTQPQQRQFGLEADTLRQAVAKGLLTGQRNLEDIATEGRREGQGAQLTFEKGGDFARRDLDKRLAAIEREKKSEERNVRSLWDQSQLLSQYYG